MFDPHRINFPSLRVYTPHITLKLVIEGTETALFLFHKCKKQRNTYTPNQRWRADMRMDTKCI